MPNNEVMVLDPTKNGLAKSEKLEIIPRIRYLTQRRKAVPDLLQFNGVFTIEVTAEIATALLALNTGNRPVKEREVAKLARDMAAEEWFFTGDTIKFSAEPIELLDGQHTLFAIERSEKSQILNIQVGIEHAAFAVIDIGKMRSAGDILGAHNIPNANVIAAAIKAYILFKNKGQVGANVNSARITNAQVATWIDKSNMRLMQEAYLEIHAFHWKEARFMSQSSWTFLLFLFTKINKEYGEEFCTLLANGDGIGRSRHSPIYFLREKLFSMQNRETDEKGKSYEVKMHYIMTAWNHYRRGEQVSKLNIDMAGPIPKPI